MGKETTPMPNESVQLRGVPTESTLDRLNTGRVIYSSIIPPSDEVIRDFAPAEGLDFYYRLRRQVPTYSGLAKLRIDAALALPQTIIPGDATDEESVVWASACADAYAMIPDRFFAERQLLFAIMDGFAVGEYIWGLRELTVNYESDAGQRRVVPLPMVCPVRLVDHRPVNFHWDRDGNLRYRTPSSAEGKILDPLSYVVARYGSAQEYGIGETRDAYVDIWKLDRLDKFSLEAMERQGYPLVQVTVPELWTEERIRASIHWARETHKNFIVVQNGDTFEVKPLSSAEASRLIGGEYSERVRDLRDSISIALLGVAFSNSVAGSYARDQVRNELRFEKTAGDAKVRDGIAQDWLDKTTAFNKPNMARNKWPRAVTDTTPTEDVQVMLTVFDKAQLMGFPISRAQFSERFGLEPAESEDDVMERTTGAQPFGGAPRGGVFDPGGFGASEITVLNEAGEAVSFESVEDLRRTLGL
jgi:hypothetical protein